MITGMYRLDTHVSFLTSISMHAPATVPGDFEMEIDDHHNVWVSFMWDGGQTSTDISPERYMGGAVEGILKKGMKESQEVFKIITDNLYANVYPTPDNTLDIIVKIVALTSDEEKEIFEARLKERNVFVNEVSLDIEHLGEIKVHMLGENNVLPTT